MLLQHNQASQTVFNAFEYERGLGQANPAWEIVPESHYPLDKKQVCFYIIAVSVAIVIGMGILIGFLFWGVQDLQKFVLTWTIVFCVVIVVCLIFLYLGGKDRRRQEKELIAQTNRRQEQMTKNKKNL